MAVLQINIVLREQRRSYRRVADVDVILFRFQDDTNCGKVASWQDHEKSISS
jgi:hypothetical protein